MTDTNILIVEDERIVAMDLQQRLKALSYNVVGQASRGEEAVAKAADLRPHLVLMDIRLEGDMDGIEAAEHIRQFNIPVVYLTAYADEPTLARAKITEPYGYILKPFEERELHTTIEMALYRHKVDNALRESEERYRRQNEYLTALHDTTLGLMRRLNLEELLQDIISRAGKLVGTEHGYVFLAEPGANTMEMRVGVGAYSGFVGTRAKPGVGLAGTVWQKGEPIAVEDYRQWPNRLPDPSRDILRAVAGVPLKSGQDTVGVIGLAYLEEGRVFGQNEMDALTRFAALTTVALDNAHLYAAAQRELAERQRTEEQRRTLERRLLEGQKLESLGLLAGGIAHDFNNLLVSVLGNVGLVLLDLEPTSPVREPIEQIKIAAQRAADLTKQMLAYSGKGRFVMQSVNLNTVIHEMTQLLKVSISKNATLKLNLAEDLPPIEADATQLRQIVMNLITNASDALGSKPGTIALTTGAVYADREYLSQTFLAPELEEGSYVFLEVADTGAGMDTETKARIFDPFFTTKFAGRGLGLAAVLGILRGHGGAIRVYSETGQGSVFRILLPCKEATTSVRATESVALQSGHGTVLVIDDEEIVRGVTKRMLERFGYTPLLAEEGRLGIEQFRAHQKEIVCILLDMTMPNMNGEETFYELRQIQPDAQVILMSGYTETDSVQRFGKDGLAGFMQKPFTPEELQEKLQSVLEKK